MDAGDDPAATVDAVVAAIELAAATQRRDAGEGDDIGSELIALDGGDNPDEDAAPAQVSAASCGGSATVSVLVIDVATPSPTPEAVAADSSVDFASPSTLDPKLSNGGGLQTAEEIRKIRDPELGRDSRGNLQLWTPTEDAVTPPPLGDRRQAFAAARRQSSIGALPLTLGRFGQFAAVAYTVNVGPASGKEVQADVALTRANRRLGSAAAQYIIGVGVLGMPYAFFHGGWALGLVVLLLITAFSYMTMLWLLEVRHTPHRLRVRDVILDMAAGSSLLRGNQVMARAEAVLQVTEQVVLERVRDAIEADESMLVEAVINHTIATKPKGWRRLFHPTADAGLASQATVRTAAGKACAQYN